MATVIHPTVGRVVWYYPGPTEQISHVPKEPLAAIIAKVHSDACVNLMVVDANGCPTGRTSVSLLAPGQLPAKNHYGYATWMPFQVAQAQKAAEPG